MKNRLKLRTVGFLSDLGEPLPKVRLEGKVTIKTATLKDKGLLGKIVVEASCLSGRGGSGKLVERKERVLI